MAKFHLTPTGQARECSAKTPEACKYSREAGETVEHYSTKEEAQAAYEKQMEKSQIKTSLTKKKTKKTNTAMKTRKPVIDKETERLLKAREKESKIKESTGKYITILENKLLPEPEYDHPGCEGCRPQDYEFDTGEYCRCGRYTIPSEHELNIGDVREAILEAYGDGRSYYGNETDELIDNLVEEYNIQNSWTYEADIRDDWYGQEFFGYKIHPNSSREFHAFSESVYDVLRKAEKEIDEY